MKKMIQELITLGGHANLLVDIMGAAMGKEPSQNAPAAVKGFYGILGYADERHIEVLLEKMEEKDPGSREILTEFFKWHFKADSVSQWILAWLYGNAFRTFITKMGSSDSRVDGKTITTVTSKGLQGEAIKAVTEKEIRRDGTDNALNFMKWMVKVIRSEPVREDGYQKLVRECHALGYPLVPAGAEKMVAVVVSVVIGGLGEVGRTAATTMKAIVDTVERLAKDAKTKLPPAIAKARADAEAELQTRRTRQHSWLGRLIRSI